MEHRLGGSLRPRSLGRCMTTYRHSPVRQRYMMRNRLTLYRRPHSPPSWVARDCLRTAGRALLRLTAITRLFGLGISVIAQHIQERLKAFFQLSGFLLAEVVRPALGVAAHWSEQVRVDLPAYLGALVNGQARIVKMLPEECQHLRDGLPGICCEVLVTHRQATCRVAFDVL